MKAWWDDELSMLRYEYTSLRNRLTNCTRNGYDQQFLDFQVTSARRKFHNTIRDKKRQHWQSFLENTDNIWKAARYLKPEESAFGNMPAVVEDGHDIEEDKDKAEALLRTFFPPTPDGWTTRTEAQRQPLIRNNPNIAIDEIEEAVQRVKPRKAPGVDGLPSIV
jgi:hypothetical protein